MAYIPYGFVQKQAGIFVEPQQEKVVKAIFQQYLNGDSLGGITDFLFEQGILSPTGQERWTRPAISKLLSNSKYIGYIISFEDYFAVQVDKGNRSNIDEDTNQRKATRYSSQNVLSGLLVCAECGANYRRITRPSALWQGLYGFHVWSLLYKSLSRIKSTSSISYCLDGFTSIDPLLPLCADGASQLS